MLQKKSIQVHEKKIQCQVKKKKKSNQSKNVNVT